MKPRLKTILAFLLIVTITFVVYRLVPQPPDWYKHYVYLAQSFLEGKFTIDGFPSYYQDLIKTNGKVFLPFPPVPAIVLMPFVYFFGTGFREYIFCQFIGALNAGLLFILLTQLNLRLLKRFFLVALFAFGSVHFYSSVMGTTWYFAHILAVFFLLLALIGTFSKEQKPWLVGLFTSAAALSRTPVVLAVPFFVWALAGEQLFPPLPRNWKDLRDLVSRSWPAWLLFGLGFLPLASFQLYYNYARFGSPFDFGRGFVYERYYKTGMKHSIYLQWVSDDFPRFHFHDVRNIPLHLYTLFFLPPKMAAEPPFIGFSKYGLGLVFMTPLFIYAFWAPWKKRVVRAAWLAVALICVPIFLHHSQGWVQVGYRYLLDFVLFIVILLALALPKKIKCWHWGLWLFSLAINFFAMYHLP